MSIRISPILPPKISVVVPLLNEADNLQELYSRLKAALEPIQKSYQIIFVDDGSIDSSFEILKQISLSDPSIQVIRFRRNFGQTAAMSAGFDHAEGEVIVKAIKVLQLVVTPFFFSSWMASLNVGE